jgi:GNAT superfamily N-acetyltransferase
MTAESYSIRLANVAELSALQDIECAAATLFLQTGYAFLAGADPTSFDQLYQQCQKGLVWVAARGDDQPVGFVIASPLDGRLYLQEIDVHPAYGRRGLGTRLILAVGEWAKRNGYTALTLSTFREVPWNAPFYARLGFVVIEETELSRGLREVREKEASHGLPIADRVCMRLDL